MNAPSNRESPEDPFMPSQVVKNFNEMVQLPQQIHMVSDKSLQPPSDPQAIIHNHGPLLTDKPNGLPLIKKNPSMDEVEEKKRKQHQNPSSIDDQSDARSARSGKSGDNKKALKRLNSRIKARQSISSYVPVNQTQRIIQNIVESVPFSIMMAIVTIYALFGDDIRILSVNKDGDDAFFVLTIICMVCFSIEIALTSISKPEYIFNFYFWLDIISTVTMILDIGWITDTWYSGDLTNASSIKSIGAASRAARKAARVIRVIRLVRLVKLYKHARIQVEREHQRKILQELIRQAQQTQNKQEILKREDQEEQELNELIQHPDLVQEQDNNVANKNNNNNTNKNNNNNNNISRPGSAGSGQDSQRSRDEQQKKEQEMQIKESQVGANLSDLVMRRVITIILSILISIPILSLDTYNEALNSYESGLYRITQFMENTNLKNVLLQQYVQFHKDQMYSIYSVHINQNTTCCDFNYSSNPTWFSQPEYTFSQYRFSDLQYYVHMQNGVLMTYSAADLVTYNHTNAILSIFQTIFVCIVLAFSAIMFNKDVSDLVIDPIEGMMNKIEMIAQNPLEAVNIEEQEDLILEELEKNQDLQKLKQKEEEKHMETYILQKLIMKVGALLAVGFGEAGSEIIAENIKRGGSVDPMIPGKKILAIFGFCDIRNFTDATEVLQQGVMVFVNEVAEIVHSTVDSFSGSANKNIGDAFLLVWKFHQDDYFFDPANPKMLKLKQDFGIKQKCDMAFLAFLKIITAVAISKKLEKYKHHPGLNQRMKDYSVKMGFGLHMGWGIEGAIGSNFKIDASYLSPNVNMASRLEAATKQFGSLILLSGILRNNLNEKAQAQLRLIDIVTVKGSIEPMELHTCDMSVKNLLAKTKEPIDKFDVTNLTQREAKKFRVVNRYQRDTLKKNALKGETIVTDIFQTDQELIAAREPYTQPFYELWKQGFDLYIKGKWSEAQAIFQKTLTMIPEHKDGPSNTLLEVIHSNGGKAPHNWQGFRELTEK